MKIGKLTPYTKAVLKIDDDEFPVMIIDSDGEHSVSINHPSNKGVSIKLPDIFILRCIHDGMPMEWEIRDYSYFKASIPSLKLNSDTPGMKMNNREAFRITFKQDIEARVSGRNKQQHIEITIENISRVGLGFTSKEELERGDFITVRIERNDFSEVFTYMIVRKTIIHQPRSTKSYGAVLMSDEIKDFMKHLNKWQLEEFKKTKTNNL